MPQHLHAKVHGGDKNDGKSTEEGVCYVKDSLYPVWLLELSPAGLVYLPLPPSTILQNSEVLVQPEQWRRE